jgi:UDP-glucose 4-epimerase
MHHEPSRPGDQARTWADTEKARLAFGYRPTVSAATGIRAQVQWQMEVLARERQAETRHPNAERPMRT